MNLEVKKIMTRKQVADSFGKSIRWVERKTALGLLTPHYAGETPLYHEEEVVSALMDGRLDARKKYDSTNKNKVRNQARSQGHDWGPSILEEA